MVLLGTSRAMQRYTGQRNNRWHWNTGAPVPALVLALVLLLLHIQAVRFVEEVFGE